jgi:hypothetical protein
MKGYHCRRTQIVMRGESIFHVSWEEFLSRLWISCVLIFKIFYALYNFLQLHPLAITSMNEFVLFLPIYTQYQCAVTRNCYGQYNLIAISCTVQEQNKASKEIESSWVMKFHITPPPSFRPPWLYCSVHYSGELFWHYSLLYLDNIIQSLLSLAVLFLKTWMFWKCSGYITFYHSFTCRLLLK